MDIETSVPWDMVSYLALLQLLPALLLDETRSDARAMYRAIVASQCVLLLAFMFVWGGYGKDSWAYLPRFDALTEDDTRYDSDWLFWMAGVALAKVFHDPWPLKMLSTLGAAILCGAYFVYLKRIHAIYVIIALFVLAVTPAFYLLMGSAVRQGIAGALAVLALVLLLRERMLPFVMLSIAAFFVHQTSIVLVAACVASVFLRRYAPYVLIISPLLGYLFFTGGQLVGLDPASHVPYTEKSQGQFHLAKFVIAYAAALVGFVLTRKCSEKDKKLVGVYVYMVAFSAFFSQYEVASERLLGYSELLLPLVAALSVMGLAWPRWRLGVLWCGAFLAGFALWLHPSILETLGYAGA